MKRAGYLAPVTSFDGGVIHSVFARACNIACASGFLTVSARELGDGPTVWRLAGNATLDLRRFFRPGQRLRRRQALAFTREVTLDFESASTWRPGPLPLRLRKRLGARLQCAAAALDRRRCLHSSVIDREASQPLRLLEDACRRLDVERATAEVHRLVGWGEGLTPAGDDALVGLLAALPALAQTDANRAAFRRSLSAAVVARVARTTDISAHYLRLAAHGDFNADVTRLTHALVGADESDAGAGLHEALETALGVGATSGADMVAGMIAGFRAWAPAIE